MSGPFNPNSSPAQIRNTPDLSQKKKKRNTPDLSQKKKKRSTPDQVDNNQYLSELLAERQKLAPFAQVLPICSILLNQEISRVTGMMPNQSFSELERVSRQGSHSNMASTNLLANVAGTGLAGPHGMTMTLQGAPPASPRPGTVHVHGHGHLQVPIPVEQYPNFNFVGRLLGCRGDTLRQVEVATGCRLYIRGKGSSRIDPNEEEKLWGRPGYEHLKEPLHVRIEADLPLNILIMRLIQAKEMVQELLKSVITSNSREEAPGPSGSISPKS